MVGRGTRAAPRCGGPAPRADRQGRRRPQLLLIRHRSVVARKSAAQLHCTRGANSSVALRPAVPRSEPEDSRHGRVDLGRSRPVRPEAFDPFADAYLADPYPVLKRAREAAPAFCAQSIDHWVVTRYDDLRHIFRTPNVFSAVNANSPLVPPCPAAMSALEEGGYRPVPTLANIDPPAHTRFRRLANVGFAPQGVAAIEPFVRDLARRFLDARFAGGRTDLVRDLAWELPAAWHS